MTTGTQLIGRAKRRADMEGSSYVDDAEWLELCNEGLAKLHDILVTAYEDYALTSSSLSIVSGTSAYNLPSDFLKVRGVDYPIGGTTYSLRPYMFRERNRYQDFVSSVSRGPPYQYTITGTQIRFIPVPSETVTATLWYAPAASQLATEGTSIDGFFAAGWERYVVDYMVICALQKEESDTSLLRQALEMTKREIIETAAQRDNNEGRRVVDVRYGREPPWHWG